MGASGKFSRRGLLGGGVAVAGALAHTTLAAPAYAESSAPIVCDNLVIGTGYGGAVAAYRLAAHGRTVRMLEMGKRWSTAGTDGKIFNRMISGADERSTWFRDRTVLPLTHFVGIDINRNIPRGPGVLDRREFGGMGVYLGRGVGGGSLVNGGMAPRPRRDVLARELPALDLDSFFWNYLPRAELRLGVNRIPLTFRETTPWYQFTRTAIRDAVQAGYRIADVPNVYDFAHMMGEAVGLRPKSALDGQVIYGNDHGKRDLRKTYLGRAEATGRVTIDTMTEALTIQPRLDGYLVTAQVRDQSGAIVRQVTYQCRHLYLGAGSVGTSELLLRSRAAGLLTNMPGELGTGWGPNGNVMFARANHLWRPTGSKQSGIPVAGIDNWDSANPCFTEIAPLPAGVDLFVQLYLAIADSRTRSNFTWNGDSLKLDWSPAHSAEAIGIVDRTFQKINNQQRTIYRVDLFGTGRPFSDNFTYHPLGGATLGVVTDEHGRLRGHPGIYVCDGALIPGMVGVNPFLTITALAERLMDDVLRRGA